MNRMTETTIGTAKVGLLADPHLGRTFIHGVPLEKRGVRERMVMDDFKAQLRASGRYEVHICLGDLFDRWAAPYAVVFQAAREYLRAARDNPGTRYYVIGGNHDIARDLEKKGALDLFELTVSACDNVTVVRHHDGGHVTTIGGIDVGLFPFHPTVAAADLVAEPIAVAFGHFDTMFGGGNLVPTTRLAQVGCRTVYTGHVHLADRFTRDGVEVIQVGSMQALAHGEDRGERYVTLRPDEIEGKDLSGKCVRILLEPGEIFDRRVDCLQLSFKRAGTDDEAEAGRDEVTLGNFDLMALFNQAFEEASVPAAIRKRIAERFEEARVGE